MSHKTILELKISDLGVIDETMKQLGFTKIQQKQYFGETCDVVYKHQQHVYPIGFTRKDGVYTMVCDSVDDSFAKKVRQEIALTKIKNGVRELGIPLIVRREKGKIRCIVGD